MESMESMKKKSFDRINRRRKVQQERKEEAGSSRMMVMKEDAYEALFKSSRMPFRGRYPALVRLHGRSLRPSVTLVR